MNEVLNGVRWGVSTGYYYSGSLWKFTAPDTAIGWFAFPTAYCDLQYPSAVIARGTSTLDVIVDLSQNLVGSCQQNTQSGVLQIYEFDVSHF